MGAFFVRLVGYALLLGVSYRVAQTWWSSDGLDGVAALQPLHDAGVFTLLLAPVILALAGAGRLRALAIFVAFALAGAAVTAPLVLARVAGG